MGPFSFVLGLVFMVVVLPVLALFHFLGRSRTQRMLTQEDERILHDIWKMAQKMEKRVVTLETILDNDNPQWRKNS